MWWNWWIGGVSWGVYAFLFTYLLWRDEWTGRRRPKRSLLVGLLFVGVGAGVGLAAARVPLHLFVINAVVLPPIVILAVLAIIAAVGWLGERGHEMLSIVLVSLLIASSILGGWLLMRNIRYANAEEFKGYIRYEQGTVDIFPEIDPSQLRLTTAEIAKSIAEMKKTSAASKVLSVHLGIYEGELCWIATLSEKPYLGMLIGKSNRVREIVVVPVNDCTGEEAFTVPLSTGVGENLWFDRDMLVYAQYNYPYRTFTRAYLTWSPEYDTLVWITTSYYEKPYGPLVDPRVEVWSLDGRLLAQYTPWEAPGWVVQRWDERWLESVGDSFGDFRWDEQNNLNFWNGIPRPSDRSADPDEEMRYQRWSGEIVGVLLFHNKLNPSLLEFVVIAHRNGIYLYSLHNLALITPTEAKKVALAGLPALPKGREYATPLALLYRIGSHLYYHIPVFVKEGERYLPAYFVLVRATDRRCIRISCAEVGGMREAVLAAYQEVGRIPKVPEERKVTGILTRKLVYTKEGNSRIWLELRIGNETEWFLAKAEVLDDEDVRDLLLAEPGWELVLLVSPDNEVLDVLEVHP